MVYIEGIILVDLMIHHAFVFTTSLFFCGQIKKLRLIVSDLLNVLLLWLYLNYHITIIFQLIIILGICFITFKYQKIRSSFFYLALNMTLGGVAEIMYLGGTINVYLILGSLLAIVIVIYIYKVLFKRFHLKELHYELIIIEGKRKFVINAYLDTGNFLMDEKNNPVIVVHKKYRHFFKRRNSIVYCQTVNSSSILNSYRFDNAYIKVNNHYKEINGSLVFSNIAFDGMIGLNTIGG